MAAGKESLQMSKSGKSKRALKDGKAGNFFRQYATRTAQQGGVAVLAKEGQGLLRTGKGKGPAKLLDEIRRWTRVAIPLGKSRFMHISNLHNNPGSTPIDKTQKEISDGHWRMLMAWGNSQPCCASIRIQSSRDPKRYKKRFSPTPTDGMMLRPSFPGKVAWNPRTPTTSRGIK